MRRIDRDALTRAVAMWRLESPARSKQIDEKLAGETWEQVARWCAYCCQCNTLRLRIHQSPPCWVHDIKTTLAAGDDGIIGDYAAARLLQRMLDAGLSRYEPDPPVALKRASAPRASLTDQPPAA